MLLLQPSRTYHQESLGEANQRQGRGHVALMSIILFLVFCTIHSFHGPQGRKEEEACTIPLSRLGEPDHWMQCNARHITFCAKKMDHPATTTIIGKYRLGRTIGEGMFAKVKLAVDTKTGESVAVKVIDKNMVLQNKLMYQVKREISTMKLLQHPNIVKIYEVIATRTKIYLVMEYAAGGQLSDKLEYLKKLDEKEARKYFQQLIDAVDYCHSRGVYHRDLKPENLLLDHRGNLKVSDFGLSVFRKPGDLLSTACGSPSYVAPEVVIHNSYDGAAADIWSCGVILYELLAGYLPFEDHSIPNLYRKISRAEYRCPEWFTMPQRKLIFRLLEPMPRKRATVAEIIRQEWFRMEYRSSIGLEFDESTDVADPSDTIGSLGEKPTNTTSDKHQGLINAFQLIAMLNDLDLSGLFEEEKLKLASKNSIEDTFAKIEVAAKDANLSVEWMNSSKVKLHDSHGSRHNRLHYTLSAEVIEVTPSHCVVQVSKSTGDLRGYKEFCRSLSNLLKESCQKSSELDVFNNNINASIATPILSSTY